jgi:cell division protease FtsH
LGQVYFSRNKQSPFLNANPDGGGDYSEMTAHLIDEEIRQIIDKQYERALRILKSRRGILDEAAEKLLQSEVIEGEALKALAQAVSQSGEPEDDSGTSKNSHALAA